MDVDKIDEQLKDAVLEERRFSGTEVVNETRMQAAINIELMYKFLRQSPKDQLKYLAISIKRYVTKNRARPEKLKIAEQYLLNELARLFNQARKMGGNLSVTLGLPRYGNQVIKAGNKLNRLVKLANKEQETKGYLSKNSQTRINEQFTILYNSFKDRMFDNNELDLDDTAVSEMTVKQSNTSNDKVYEFININNQDKLDIMKEFKDIVGLNKCKFISKGSDLSIVVNDVNDKDNESLLEIQNDYSNGKNKKFSDTSGMINKDTIELINPLDLKDDDIYIITKYNIYPVSVSSTNNALNYIEESADKIESTNSYDWYSLDGEILGVSNDKKSILLNNLRIDNYNKIIKD